jgi:hypothetical protein
VSPIMKAKETRVARGTSPFITKAGASLIPSSITKACASPFITKAGASPIPDIERRMLQRNSGGARSTMFLPFLFLFGGAL